MVICLSSLSLNFLLCKMGIILTSKHNLEYWISKCKWKYLKYFLTHTRYSMSVSTLLSFTFMACIKTRSHCSLFCLPLLSCDISQVQDLFEYLPPQHLDAFSGGIQQMLTEIPLNASTHQTRDSIACTIWPARSPTSTNTMTTLCIIYKSTITSFIRLDSSMETSYIASTW